MASASPDRILIVAPSWVGDMVMAQPMCALLHARRPDAVIDVLAPAWVLPLARRMAEITDVIVAPFGHGQFALSARRALATTLRERRYRQAIVLPNSWKSALVPWLAGIGRRTGFTGEFRYGLLNDARRLDPVRLPRMVDRFAALAGDTAAPDAPTPLPVLQTAPPAATKALLERLGLNTDRPIACFCPGAEYGPAKRWPPAYFAELARAMNARGMQVWLIGAGKDTEPCGAIAAAAGGACIDLAGRTSLDEAADLLGLAALVVTNDSGLMHVAAALGRPTVAIFGSSSPDFTPPLSPRAVIARHPVPCSPCFERICPLGHFDCMNRLLPAQLVAATEEALALP